MPGLGISFGRGGSTTFPGDLVHSDAILIMGSNMAECHPVAFRWVMKAKERGALVMHADPRFTRTSAMAGIYAPLRAGSDIVFLGALINYVLQHEKFFREYVVPYTNAATLVSPEFQDTEELEGLFSGFRAGERRYDPKSWGYQTEATPPSPPFSRGGGEESPPFLRGGKEGGPLAQEARATPDFAALVQQRVGGQPKRDPTLEHPDCVFQILKRHYRRYTPELVEEVCGTPRDVFLKVAETLTASSGPERTSALCYAVGWTQHTVGVQIIRAASILQLLLGNIGRPGGGIVALRGHATIQGSTDIATLYNLLPGYLNAPSALKDHDTLARYIAAEVTPTGYWARFPAFIVSLLKAWFGDDATPENDFAFHYLPRTVGDHSHLPMFVDMMQGRIKGFFAMGQNPAVGGQNASFQRKALAKLDWLVVRDLYETETASFWKDSPEVQRGELRPQEVQTEVFFLPAAAVPEMDGSFTNTQRLVQWHHKAVDPPDDARSDLWFTYQLGQRLKRLYADSREPRDRPIQALVWDYVDEAANHRWRIKDEPSAELVLKEINGYRWAAPPEREGEAPAEPVQAGGRLGRSLALPSAQPALAGATPLKGFEELKDDGSTPCGAWIYGGIYAPDEKHPLGFNHAARREADDWVSGGWAFAWPANRRILYNRAAADPLGRPWPKEARLAGEHGGGFAGYVSWDTAAGRWVGYDVPDFPATKPPTAAAQPGQPGVAAHDGASPFIMKSDGKAWLFAPSGLVDGPLPAHYEPYESPVANLLYRQQASPVVKVWDIEGNLYAAAGSADYPHVLSTYRLTEHHLSGTMSRWLPWLAELQPELFCELSPEHAAEIGVRNTEWVVISTPRGSIRAKALVTRRIRPYRIAGRTIHHVGLPWHWGYKGLSTGDVVNDLSALVADPNVTIHEAKVFVCQVAKAPGARGRFSPCDRISFTQS